MKIEEEIKQAMRDKNVIKLQVLRALKSEITNAALRKGNVDSEVNETEILAIIRKQVKQREDSIQQFISGDRYDLAAKERDEKAILEKYLPAAMDMVEIRSIVGIAINDTGATTKKEMGKVMKRATELAGGRVDGKTLSTVINSILG